jgi:hypothetical protein
MASHPVPQKENLLKLLTVFLTAVVVLGIAAIASARDYQRKRRVFPTNGTFFL